MANLKVWVIGAGNWGKNVIRTFHSLGALGGIVEADESRHAALKTEYPSVPIRAGIDFSEIGEAAVAIATPVPSHFSVAHAALSHGKDVFVEKPLTLSTREAEELTTLAREKGRILMVGHLLLYQPAVRWMRSFFQEGGLGRLRSLHQERLNFGRARNVENALWSLGVHDVAVLLHLVGEAPESLSVRGQAVLNAKVEDDVYLHMKFPGGVEGHLHVSWMWPEKRRQLTVIGEKGMLVFDEIAQTVTLHRKKIASNLAQTDEGAEIVFQGTDEPLKLELGQFLEHVAHRTQPVADGINGTQVVRVLEQCSQALEKP